MDAEGDLASLFGEGIDDMVSLFGEEDNIDSLSGEHDPRTVPVAGEQDSSIEFLFGGDDFESHFGDDNQISSPFMEEEGEPTSRNDSERLVNSISTGNQLTFPPMPNQFPDAVGLSLPMQPSQPGEIGLTLPPLPAECTMGTETVPAMLRAQETDIPAMQTQQIDQSGADSAPETVPTSPDPLVTPLCDQVGHTSGNSVVSTHNLTDNVSSLLKDQEVVNNGLEAILDLELLKYRAKTAQKQSLAGLGDRGSMLHEEAIVRWHSERSQEQHPALPRRIDLSCREMEALTPFIRFRRGTLLAKIYGYLELDALDGKKVSASVKDYLRGSAHFAFLLEKPGKDFSQDMLRRCVGQVAWQLLITESWGSKWWGPYRSIPRDRKLFWPESSTVIFLHFMTLVHRAVSVARSSQRSQSRGKTVAQADQAHLQTIIARQRPILARQHQPIPTRQNQSNLVRQYQQSLLEIPSVRVHCQPTSRSQSSTPQPSNSPASSSDETDSLGRAQTPPIQVAPVQTVPLGILAQSAMSKKRKLDDYVADAHQYVLDLPPDARLTYRITVKNQDDGKELAPPVIYRHQDDLVANGAFASLKKSFEEAGQAPAILVRTSLSMRMITDEASWEQAVLCVYNQNPSACVEVDVIV